MLRTRLAGERVYLFFGCRWLKWLGADGLTLYRCLCFRAGRGTVTANIIGHELVHVTRWVEAGFFRWLWRHLPDLFRHGDHQSAEEQIAYTVGPVMAQRGDVQALVRFLQGAK